MPNYMFIIIAKNAKLFLFSWIAGNKIGLETFIQISIIWKGKNENLEHFVSVLHELALVSICA